MKNQGFFHGTLEHSTIVFLTMHSKICISLLLLFVLPSLPILKQLNMESSKSEWKVQEKKQKRETGKKRKPSPSSSSSTSNTTFGSNANVSMGISSEFPVNRLSFLLPPPHPHTFYPLQDNNLIYTIIKCCEAFIFIDFKRLGSLQATNEINTMKSTQWCFYLWCSIIVHINTRIRSTIQIFF